MALWTSFNAQISIAKSQLKDSQTIVAEDMFTKGIAEMSAYLDSAESEADDSEEFASDAEEFARGTRSDGQTVPHASTGAHDNAKDYKDLAKDWASKIGGAVESGEYSAKYYAIVSDTRSQEAEAYAIGTKGGTPVPAFADKNSKDWATKTGSTVDGTNYSSKQYALNAKASADIVEAHATAIEAIYADLTNIDAVATDIQDDDSIINTVAENIQDVNTVAESISDVNDVADDLNDADSNIKTVAANITDVGAVATNISNVNDVADNETNINTVAGKSTQITTVAGIASNVTTVAGIASDVTAVAGISSDVSAVEDIKTDVSAVADIDTDVSAVSAIKDDVSAVATIDDDVTTVATDISDVSAVASDITKVTAVADDLTNIDAVADDLTNIDNAVNYALEAEGFAVGEQNGTPVSSGSPYYQNNAKYYSQEVPDLKDAIDANSQRIENLEVAVSGSLVQTNTDATMASTKTITNANEILPWAILKRVGARAVAWNQQMPTNAIATQTKNGITLTNNGDGSYTISMSTAYSSDTDFIGTVYLPLAIGHSYFMYCGQTTINYGVTNLTNTNGNVARKFTKSTGNLTGNFFINVPANVVFNGIIKPWISDMTTIGEDSLTADQFRAKFPASHYPYNTGEIIPLNPTGFKVVGFNKWDEETRTGYYSSNGEFVSYEWALANKNPIPAVPSTVYCMYSAIQKLDRICFYDASMNFISLVDASPNEYTKSFTTPSNCAYINFNLKSDYGITYLHNVCINISQSDTSKPLHDGVYAPYSTVTVDTSVLAGTHYVNENCYDYVENVMENGVTKGKKHVVSGTYTFDGTENYASEATSSTGVYRQRIDFGFALAKECLNTTPANISFPLYKTISANESYNMSAGAGIALLYDASKLYVADPNFTGNDATTRANFKQHIYGKTIYFELANETVTLHDPIPNIPCEDGTTVQAVTPQTDLVNAIDVPSTIAYMTKISS